jgi:hypothetical protein
MRWIEVEGPLAPKWPAAPYAVLFDDLPAKARDYVLRLEELAGAPVSCIGVGPGRDQTIVRRNEVITDSIARKIEELGVTSIQVRSPLTCQTARGVCARCYGQDMSTGKPVEIGMAVGIIAAQSIGEPGTQLTMRTFHTGGAATRALLENSYKSTAAGTIQLRDCMEVEVTKADGTKSVVALKRNGELALIDNHGRELERFRGLLRLQLGHASTSTRRLHLHTARRPARRAGDHSGDRHGRLP